MKDRAKIFTISRKYFALHCAQEVLNGSVYLHRSGGARYVNRSGGARYLHRSGTLRWCEVCHRSGGARYDLNKEITPSFLKPNNKNQESRHELVL